VQLYIHDLVASLACPVKELRDFQKVFLKAGESKTISFRITADQLAFYNEKLLRKAEPGEFRVFVGVNSVNVKEAEFKLEKMCQYQLITLSPYRHIAPTPHRPNRTKQ
jgi:beta-glucosidase